MYEEKGVQFHFAPPPPHAITRPTSRNIGTAALSRGPAAAAQKPQFIQAPIAPPPAARTAPVFRSIDEDLDPVPPVPPQFMAGPRSRSKSPGRKSLTAPVAEAAMPPIPETPLQPPVLLRARGLATSAHQPAPIIVPPRENMPSMPPSPEADFIPIAHQRIPQKLNRAAALPSSPRDALGIPISKIKLSRAAKSKKADVDGDTEPLSPSTPAFARGLEEGLPSPKQAKPKRKTVWGVLEGWWDLNLLERGKSMRRKN